MTDPVDRPTVVPEPPAAPEPLHSTRPPPPHSDTTPPSGTVAWKPPARPLAWSEVVDRLGDTLTRRGLRALIGYWIYHLQATGKLSPETLIGLVACAVGVEAAVRAWRERKASTAVAVALPLTLAVAGELARVAPLTHAAGYLAAVATFAGNLRRP